jgi:hypothetical protein
MTAVVGGLHRLRHLTSGSKCRSPDGTWAGWLLQEQAILQQFAATCGLAHARFPSRSDVVQLVTYDGERLGHVIPPGGAAPRAGDTR